MPDQYGISLLTRWAPVAHALLMR